MSLYSAGTVIATNNSNTITGAGTLFVANVKVGDDFKVSGENAEYNVISVDSDTQIKIAPNYAGTTASGLLYSISRDFTQNYGLTEVQPGDTDWPFRMTETVRKLDGLLQIANLDYTGLFQMDEYGDLMPILGVAADDAFELDANGDIQPKETVTQTTSIRVAKDANGYILDTKQVFGGIYEANELGSAITITSAGTYYQWVTVGGNEVSGTGYCEYDSTNKQLIVKKAGKYLVAYKMVFSTKTGTIFECGVFRTPSAGSPAILPAHQGWAAMPRGEEIYPSSMVATTGVLTGSVSQLQAADQNFVTGSELNALPGFQYDFIFATNKVPRFFNFQGRYIHTSTHEVKWLAYDYGTSAWVDLIARATVPDDMSDIGSDFDRTQDYIFPSGTFVQGGEVKLRCEHIDNGGAVATVVYFDKLYITPRDVRGIATVSFPVSLAVDDRLDLRVTNNESGVIVYSHITNLCVTKIGD